MLTTARRDGSDWILDGRKMWITNGGVSKVAIVWARAKEGIRGFLVPTESKGFSAPEQKHKWSLRASMTSELVLDQVRVPADAMLPGAEGLAGPLGCLTQARYGIAWGAVGAASACFDEALRYARERIVFDKPLAAFQIPQKKFADCATDITLGQLIALRVGRMKDDKQLEHQHVSMAKRNNVAMALNVARVLRDVLGANGVTLEYHVGRHMCNLESVYTYEGTHDIHTLAIGHHLTGIPSFR
jgi:glutaryl-CoA dehydrogenase